MKNLAAPSTIAAHNFLWPLKNSAICTHPLLENPAQGPFLLDNPLWKTQLKLAPETELIIFGHSVQVSKELAVKMYSLMVTIQMLDTIIYEAQRQGRLSFYLTATGEEAINIGSAAALTLDDVVLPQGTAGVAIAGLLGAVRAQGRPMIDFPRIGALNVARKIMARMVGGTEIAFESARSQFWVVDAKEHASDANGTGTHKSI